MILVLILYQVYVLTNSSNNTGFSNYRKTRNGFTRWTLSEIFFTPEKFTEQKGLLNDLTEGLTAQHGQQWDNQFAPDLINHLFETEKGEGGMDLVALNIQRGRDHGLPGMIPYCTVIHKPLNFKVMKAYIYITYRKHFILGYNAYREICQVGKARRWEDFEDYISATNIRKLKEVYLNVDDVDLYVGGFLERQHSNISDSPIKVGPTFKCIIGDTFAR